MELGHLDEEQEAVIVLFRSRLLEGLLGVVAVSPIAR
jgi:hypothetical protein